LCTLKAAVLKRYSNRLHEQDNDASQLRLMCLPEHFSTHADRSRFEPDITMATVHDYKRRRLNTLDR